MGSLILMELAVEPLALLMHGQGLVDEGLTRSLQDLLCLLWIIAGSHWLEKPIDDGEKGLAPSRHAGSAGQVDLLAFTCSGGVSAAAAAALLAPSADGTDAPTIITSADSTG
jgi:hypothetical protein